MDKSILNRLERIETQISRYGCVGILELQPDGTWTLTGDNKVLGQYATEEAGVTAFHAKYQGTNSPLIIIDL